MHLYVHDDHSTNSIDARHEHRNHEHRNHEHRNHEHRNPRSMSKSYNTASPLSSNVRRKERRIPLTPTDRVQTHVPAAKTVYKSRYHDDKFNSRQGQKILLYVKAPTSTVGLTSGLHLQRYSGRSVKPSP